MMSTKGNHSMEDDGSDDEKDLAFASFDFTGVNFGDEPIDQQEKQPGQLDDVEHEPQAQQRALDDIALWLEQQLLFPTDDKINDALHTNSEATESLVLLRVRTLFHQIKAGQYMECLRGDSAVLFFNEMTTTSSESSVANTIRHQVLRRATSLVACVEMEFLAIAALHLFQQVNYTGPAFDVDGNNDPLACINPHDCFREMLLCRKDEQNHSSSLSSSSTATIATPSPSVPEENNNKKTTLTAPKRDVSYHNRVLSELAVDGEWPSQTCQVPYLLLLSRSILLPLADPKHRPWSQTNSESCDEDNFDSLSPPPLVLVGLSSHLKGAKMWNARAAVAHERLLQNRSPTLTLWKEVNATFERCRADFCDPLDNAATGKTSDHSNATSQQRIAAATVMLEWGLAQYHFDRPNGGRRAFTKAVEYSGLVTEVTGAEGKRTKFQQKATAQMVVRAASMQPSQRELPGQTPENKNVSNSSDRDDGGPTALVTTAGDKQHIKAQMVQHSEEEILLERIHFTEDKENQIPPLTILDQCILLALCLDVKNSNPVDGLTAEEMGAYLARVLDHHDDWMVYATALLERSWLEFERSHGRERAILQIQALTDQHTNRLTITQSTRKSIEEDSAPAQERLIHIHHIVYPPRWAMLRDLAERYAALGIVTTAAELFTEIELWDEVVECYRRAGKENIAEAIVRERLAVTETPRMWTALGDLTHDPTHYEKAIELSNGRFSNALTALGRYYFERGDFERSLDYYEKSLKIHPLAPGIWFRVGTISMKLEKWNKALQAFSVVVQQEPEEADAWANVAAVHMHNKKPGEAYPALVESLKHNRDNWRVWVSKLYTCLDLEKYDEAIQACDVLLNIKSRRNAGSDGVDGLDERCIRAIVGGSLRVYKAAVSSSNRAALDSARRTLSRVHDLLDRLATEAKTEAWLYETTAYFNEQVGRDEQVFENLMKEYRALQSIAGWERDEFQIRKVCQVVLHICHFYRHHQQQASDGVKVGLSKCKYLLTGVIKKTRGQRVDASTVPPEVARLEQVLVEVLSDLAKCSVANPSG